MLDIFSQNSRVTTLYDVLAEGKPYGKAFETLKGSHHDFLTDILASAGPLGEQAIMGKLTPEDVFDPKGNIAPSAGSEAFYAKAKTIIESAFDGQEITPPDDLRKTPEIIDAISKLLIRSALGHAEFFRRACPDILTVLSAQKALPDTTSGKDAFNHRADTAPQSGADILASPVGITVTKLLAIAREHHDPAMTGGGAREMGLAAYHLSTAMLDPTQIPHAYHTKNFPEIYDAIRMGHIETIGEKKKDPQPAIGITRVPCSEIKI